MSSEFSIDLKRSVISPDTTIRQAMELMTKNNMSIVLVADPSMRLLGVVVDGDIRRALTNNADLAQPVSSIMSRRPRTAPFDLADDELSALAADSLSTWLPLIDAEGRLRGLLDVVRMRRTSRRQENAVVLMAGGRGERLLPHTERAPKPMMEVGGRPLLETLIRILHGHGFERFYLAVNYLAGHIEDYFGDGGAMGVSIEYLHEDKPLGTAGCIGPLAGREKTPVLVMNADVLTRFNPRAMLAFHEQEDALATIAVHNFPVKIPFGVVQVNGTRFAGIREKPVEVFPVSAGIYVLSPNALGLIPGDRPFDMPELLTAVDANWPGRVSCFPISDYWIDIGRAEDLERARAEFDKHF